jgi:cobalamin-dependent methionine synthase I
MKSGGVSTSIQKPLSKLVTSQERKILMATVKGDVHDIGKILFRYFGVQQL